MDWKPEAIEAALDAYMPAGTAELRDERDLMRAALDAAIKAQNFTFGDNILPEDKVTEIRAEAFEEAAKIAEGSFPFDIETWMHSTKKEMTAHLGNAIATTIRALAKEPPK